MTAKFIAEEGVLQGLVLPLEDGDQWMIGRDPDACQLIVEDPEISRMHAMCLKTEQGFKLENLSKANLVQVNHEQINASQLLYHGDLVKIGRTTFRFYDDASKELQENEGEKLSNENALKENVPEAPSITEPLQEFIDADTVPIASSDALNDLSEDHLDSQFVKEIKPQLVDAPLIESQTEDFIDSQLIEAEKVPEPQDIGEHLDNDENLNEPIRNSLFDEESTEDKFDIAKITFGLLDTGKWLLKVISGPNNGAEFSLQAGSSYILGTDPNICDLIFHDTSVSRQHAKIVITPSESITIEDLKSRNGIIVDGTRLEEKLTIDPNIIVTIGTSSFVIYDREAEMHTIISPLLPAIVKKIIEEPTFQDPPVSKDEQVNELVEEKQEDNPLKDDKIDKEAVVPKTAMTLGALILIGILTGVFIVAGVGISSLFKTASPIELQKGDPVEALNSALTPFSSNVKFTFNPNTGQLLLIGHVLTSSDRNQLLYALQGLHFIKNLDDSGLVIDEGVWREINQVVEKNPDWKGINIMSPTPGHFVVSGYLRKRNDADHLSEYLNANFPYPDLLEKRIIVDEEVIASVNNLLQSHGYRNVTVQLDNGELTMTGSMASEKSKDLNQLITEIKQIRGVRNVRNQVTEVGHDDSIINISSNYDVTGFSKQGGKLSVIINGRILMPGDSLDGMLVTSIQGNVIFLERDNTKYRIDFNK